MRRRRFLTALGVSAGLAGCSSTPDPAASDTPTLTPVDPPATSTEPPTDPPTESPHGDDPEDPLGELGAASVVDLETVARTYALAPTRYRSDDDADVRVAFVETATADHPARVRATLRNAADWSNTFRLDETPPFGRRIGRVREHDRELTYRSSLAFAPTERHDVASHVPDVERASDGTWRLASDIDRQWTPETIRLEGGESVTGEWYLVGLAEGVEAGRPTGRYAFRSSDTTLTVTAWNTERPGPTGRSAFAGRSVPSLPGNATTDWYHDAGPETPAYLEPNRERADLPGAVDLSLYNFSHGTLSGNSWNLYKLHEGAWHHVTPWAHTAVLRTVPPGGRREYALRAFTGAPLPFEGAITVGYLGGGTYAFEAMYGADGGPEHVAALLELRGPPMSVAPSEDATAERDGSTVRVEWPHRPELPRATLTVERLGPEATADERLVPEQVMRRRHRGLRNTLAYVEPGIERVVLRTDRNTVSTASGASSYEPATRRVEFEGDTFELTSRFDDDTNGAEPDTRRTVTGAR